MQVSLRQAHKLVEKIASRLTTVKIEPLASVSSWTQDAMIDVVRNARQKFEAEVARQLEMLNARQEIRMSIQAANAMEVNNLVAIRKGLLDELATYRHIQTVIGSTQFASADELEAQRKAHQNNPNASVYGSSALTFSVLDEAKVAELDKKINDLQLRVEGIEDQLTTANSKSSIVLTAEVARVLRREGIIQ